MGYAGAEWLAQSGFHLSELGSEVGDLLGDLYSGIYHINNRALGKVDWENPHRIEITVSHEGYATYDFSFLTHLVILCHDRCIRCAIQSRGFGYLRLSFTKRKRDGGCMERHPTIEEAISNYRM